MNRSTRSISPPRERLVRTNDRDVMLGSDRTAVGV
jgi:hypothetical protein